MGEERGADIPLWPRYRHDISDALFPHFHSMAGKRKKEKGVEERRGFGLGIWFDVGG